MAIALVDELGRDIERRWSALDFDLSAFPGLCADRLGAAGLHAKIKPDQIVGVVFDGGLPQQSDPLARFGQPPVTLFRTRRFYIDALFWVDGTTTIHDHAFSGAFQVLSGESIETNFTFTTSRDVSGHIRIGELRAQGSALRRAGEVRAVPSGSSYIHSLFHLARPSVTLVARTYRDPSPGVQLNYSTAGIGYDPFLDDPIRDRMVQVVEMLRKTEDKEFEHRVGDLIAMSDLHTAFSLIRACARLPDMVLLGRLVERVRDSRAAERIAHWVTQRRRTEFLISRRALVRDHSLRFLLAVLLNAQSRDGALALVASYAPEVDPARKLAAWLKELSNTTMRLQLGNAPFEPNVLGLPTFGPGSEEAVADLLSGRQRVWTPAEQEVIDLLRACSPLQPLFIC